MSSSRAFIRTVSRVNLVFGLDWFAVLGGVLTREVRRVARQNKATHAVWSGEDTAAVGVARLRGVGHGVVLYSAAQLVAQRYSSGTVAFLCRLGKTQWWLVAVHEGAVIARTDYMCATQDEALAVVRQLHQAYPALTMLDDLDATTELCQLATDVSPAAQLQRITTARHLFFSPFFWVALSVLGIVVVPRAWSLIYAPSQRHEIQEVSSEFAWDLAMREVTDAHWIHGVAGTQALLESVYGMPVRLDGWQLSYVDCVSHQSQWQCYADYDRSAQSATNEGFLDHASEDWTVSFTSLEQVRVQWRQTAQGLTATLASLKTASYHERDLFSRLQAIRTAFSVLHIEDSKPLDVPAPLNSSGQHISRPQGAAQLAVRAIRIQAPLRSLSVLLPYCDAIAWKRLVMAVDMSRTPDLTHSRLNLTLQGALYEKS